MSSHDGSRVFPSAALVSLAILAAVAVPPGAAFPGDTTWVRTFDHDFYNWATPHVETFDFPDSGWSFDAVVCRYRIECPGAPADCDPWDRIGYLQVLAGGQSYEIVRIITPYDITGTGRPGHCVWEIDVTDYEPLLHGQVTLSNYIESWIGGERGWIVTIDFGLVEGIPALEPIRVENLWQSYYTVYGDPARPPESVLVARTMDIHPEADAVKVRVMMTGHGQGNSANCAEFCQKRHTVLANGQAFTFLPWRSDCAQNPCGPQGGTWTLSRAGWCPGDKVTPYDFDVTDWVEAGQTAVIDLELAAYENLCRPDNPSCISGQTCPDCNYNYTGHTEPHLSIQAQLVTFRRTDPAGVAEANASRRSLILEPSEPNPARTGAWLRFRLVEAAGVAIRIHDAGGRCVRVLDLGRREAGSHRTRWDGRDGGGDRLPAGVYFYTIQAGGGARGQKLLLVD